jgi:hypothetical protein
MGQGGASIGTIPDLWERRDVRTEMTYAVQGLIEHLNEHVEYYTNNILWNLDRNKLWMLIDGFYVPGTKAGTVGVSPTKLLLRWRWPERLGAGGVGGCRKNRGTTPCIACRTRDRHGQNERNAPPGTHKRSS